MINLAKDFSPVLRNRNKYQTDGKFTAIEFRKKFLNELDSQEWWGNESKTISIDLSDIDTLGPSWVNEAFAYFARYNINSEALFKKINFIGLDEVWKEIIEQEMKDGYSGEN